MFGFHESYQQSFARGGGLLYEGVLIFAVCLAYLTFHTVAVYSIVKSLLGYADEHGYSCLHLCVYGEEYGTYGVC